MSDLQMFEVKKEGFVTERFFKNADQKLHGLYTVFHPGTTNPKQTMNYVDGKLDGKLSVFDKNNQLIRSVEYKANKLHGKFRSYEKGALAYESNYKMGKLDGTARAFHPNSNLLLKEQFVDGKRHGESSFYTDSKQLLKRQSFSNGKPHGSSVEYFINGKMSKVTHYAEGKMHGTMAEYNPDGTLRSKTIFKAGKPLKGKMLGKL